MGLSTNFRHALRALIRQPGYAAGAAGTLALGVGAATALFTVVHAVLLEPLPYASPGTLVTILHGPSGTSPVSPADYFDFRREAASFVDVAAAEAWGVNLGSDDRTIRVPAMHVSPHLFALLGAEPALGRGFAHGEDEPGRHRVALIADGLWRRQFGADRTIVGRDIRLNGEPYTIVGVMAPGFRFAPFWQTQAEVWAPLVLDDRRTSRGGRSLRVFGRLREGIGLDAAQAEIGTLTARLERDYPDSNTGITTTVTPLTEMAVGAVRPTLLALMGMATLVLLIAVANVSTLMLVRALGRRHEMAVRAALGADAGRVIGMIATEGLLLGIFGAAGGALLASATVSGLVAFLPADALPDGAATFGPSVFLVALGIAASAAAVASVVPMLLASRPDLARVLVDAARGATAGPVQGRARAVLVAAEVSLALVLLTGAALLGRTLLNLREIDTGLEPDGLVTMSVSLDGTTRGDSSGRVRYFEELQSRLEADPSVTSASAINHLPLAGDLWRLGYLPEGRPEPSPGQEARAAYRVVLPGYFGTVGQRLVRGRDFSLGDRESAVPVAIVNETLARRQWPDSDAVGQRLIFPGPQNDRRPVTIVGIVGDARQLELTQPPTDEIYLPLPQRAAGDPSRGAMTVVARATPGREAAALGRLRSAAWEIDRRAATYEVQSMTEVLSHELWREAFAARLVTAFALLALVLAAVGIHGVVAYAVAGRMREFGVRLALGATPAGLRRLAFADALAPLAGGLGAGIIMTVMFAGTLESLLYGVSTQDPWTVGGAAAVLGLAALAAAWRPARRAAKLDPLDVLRAP